MLFVFLGYLKNHQPQKAVDLFYEISNPDEVIIILLFNACAQLANREALALVKKISSTIPRSFLSNPKILASQFDAMIKCGDLVSAELAFNRTKMSVISYGNLMNAFNEDGQPNKTIELFNQMKSKSIDSNSIVYLCVISALAQIGIIELSQTIVNEIPGAWALEPSIQNALVDMWVSRK